MNQADQIFGLFRAETWENDNIEKLFLLPPPPKQSSSERKWDGAFPQLLGQMVVWLVPYACPLEFRVSWRCDE